VSEAPLRILALNWRCMNHPQAGGSEINLFEQAGEWARRGHHVTVFCSDPGRERAPERDETAGSVEIVRRGGKFTVYLFAALFLLMNSRKFDCVLDVANGIPFFAPLFTSKPVLLLVHHVHDRQWFVEFPAPVAAVGWFLERRVVPLLYRNKNVVAVSPTTRDAMSELGFDEARINVVYNGVRIPERARNAASRGNRITYVGRIRRYKRLEKLVHATAGLRNEFPDIRLEIAGSGDAVPQIEDLVAKLGVGDHVCVLGRVDEDTKAEILDRSAVFATPSMHEGWGLTVLEANGHGCPAVAFDVPGLRAAIKAGETGILASDDDDFQEALAFLLRDDGARGRYSAAAREWAGEFSWERCADGTLSALRAEMA
jgi:glycosyltransferase involved in cell wall biosynthesis